MARRRSRRDDDYDDDRDDRRDRRGGYPRGGSNTTPLIIGGVVCVALIAGTLVFVTQSKGKPKRRRTTSSRQRQRDRANLTAVSTGEASGSTVSSDGGAGGRAAGRKPVNLRCVGQWIVRTPDKEKGLPDPRHVEATCPSCGKKVSYKAESCSCGQGLIWPNSITCTFCKGDGVCTVCGEDGMCPWCLKHPPRAMMGIQLDKCAMGCTDRKCPACKGSRRCSMCEGNGKIQLSDRVFK